MSLLEISGLGVRFGGVVALDGVDLALAEGEVHGLIGPNGAGKTTLFNCISRFCRPAAGAIVFSGRDLLSLRAHAVAAAGIARTFQNLALLPRLTVRENVMLGGHVTARPRFLAALLAAPGERARERDLRREADATLDRLGLAAIADRPVAGLPLGTLKRIELARALCARPRLLLLDEPANGLTHEEVEELAELLLELRRERALTILLVEHHLGLVSRVCERVSVLDFGRKIADGPPEQVKSDPAVVAAYLGAAA
ncbi:ABC transporter ATP-binding protein [Thermoleophilum album]|uniref:ABC transporter ATP-binding protein n=1 Tax=Thermoleophilum album TaxID=29539 RepID=UPI00237C9197|nr:ABC transporter ATP-binding protein [Thermoleophilum album]WDT94615.1 ABC transporter ATP-binding protein [Thermoleophilum album]